MSSPSTSRMEGQLASTMAKDAGDGAHKASETLNRSCEPCRASKVRCQIKSKTPGAKCQRCQITNRRCMFVMPARRKPRKRTDTRIKELEQKLQAMETSFLNPSSNPAPPPSRPSRGASRSTTEASDLQGRRPLKRKSEASDYRSTSRSPYSNLDDCDNLQRLVSIPEAGALFDQFVSHYMTEFPLVVFPPGTTAAEVRSSKPTLFLAVIAAASGSSDPSLFRALNVELLKEFANKIMISNMKDLELVQAMLIMAAWYFPPDQFEDLKHYQYIHMAATMAMDIGLGELTGTSTTTSPAHGSPQSLSEATADDIERFRTILACYLLCAGVSLSMDRPNMLTFTPFMERCLNYLKESPNAAPTDKKLAAWVELQRLSEEIADSFRRGSSPADPPSFEDPSTRAAVDLLSRKFDLWWDNTDKKVLDDSMTIAYHYNRARIFEVVLYASHSLEDLRPPFLIRSSSRGYEAQHPLTVDPAYTRALFNLIHEAQRCIRAFTSMKSSSIGAAPMMHWIRCFYGLTVLLNLWVDSSSQQGQGQGTNDLSKILEPDTLGIEDILDKWFFISVQASGFENCRTPTKFSIILAHVQRWLCRAKGRGTGQKGIHDLRLFALLAAKEPPSPPPKPSDNPELQSQPVRRSSLPVRIQEAPPADLTTSSFFTNNAHPDGTMAFGDRGFVPYPIDPSSLNNPGHDSQQYQQQQPVYSVPGPPNTRDSNEWMSLPQTSSFDAFVPMELDPQNAMSFFEGLSNDVAHSFIIDDHLGHILGSDYHYQ